jgi:hypothetical protein
MNRAARKAIRTLLQVIASGGLTALVSAIAGGIEPATAAIFMAAWTVIVTYTQNALEGTGTIPTLLPSPQAGVAATPLVAPKAVAP